MGKDLPPPTIRVPYETTDKQLVEVLRKVLPDLLAKRMNIDRLRAEQAAETLAVRIVYAARQCNEAHRVGDVSNRILLNAPSEEECADFKKAVDEIIRIRYVEEIRKPTLKDAVKTTSGRLWLFLRTRVLGLPPLPPDTNTASATAIRG